MKDFINHLQKIKEQYEGREYIPPKSNIFISIFLESILVFHAFQSFMLKDEHFLLALLKLAPHSLPIQYLETIKSRENWKKQWQEMLMNEANNNKLEKQIFPKEQDVIKIQKIIKTMGLERALIKCEVADENCIFLALLRYQDFDGLVYKDALQFIKKNLQN